jgi:hypothetical protein
MLGAGEEGALKVDVSIISPAAFLIWMAALFLGTLTKLFAVGFKEEC